ncbi:hypothetical protein [Paenibacillus segetis]|uniref:Uncharacterized protein n=1 Tax=Paenibacillus segetis TaxID=1325360 RepID=A0ABQ1YS12_9BACL|nr:hypothetical protein [Paenibacillus segetis]GGH35420.1 hypothetical protein GCM10008013_41700 [Paenibacillus segetis]
MSSAGVIDLRCVFIYDEYIELKYGDSEHILHNIRRYISGVMNNFNIIIEVIQMISSLGKGEHHG